MQTILIGGAMDIEIEYFISQLCGCEKRTINSFDFYSGQYSGKNIIISKTQMGLINAAIATMIGINHFKPDFVINQGTAGAHVLDLKTGDIVIGEKCVNINALETLVRNRGEGSAPESWKVMERAKPICADGELVKLFESADCGSGKKVCGTIGSGDLFSREYDRIVWLNSQFGELCEDMESISVYEACASMNVPCVSVRTISNNELLGETFCEDTAIDLQKFILSVLK